MPVVLLQVKPNTLKAPAKPEGTREGERPRAPRPAGERGGERGDYRRGGDKREAGADFKADFVRPAARLSLCLSPSAQ